MIEAHGLTKDYGDKRAVDDLSFTVEPGVVTGQLQETVEAQELFMTLGDPSPSGLYEVAAWLLAPAPDDFSTPAQDDSVDLEEPEDPSTS